MKYCRTSKKAIKTLQQIAAEVGNRNTSLSEKESEKLADKITLEAVDRLAQRRLEG